MTAPAPLIDLEEYAEYVTGDALKETRLDGVIAAIRGYCGWHIAPAYDATFVVDGPGGRVLSLPTLRLNSVVSVTENGTELDADAFEWSHDGTLRRSCNWTERYRGIVVVANSGFDKIPADLLAVVIDAFAQAKAIPLNEPTNFPAKVRDRMARVGHPIRKEIRGFSPEGGHEFLKLDASVPTILILGGSQGSRAINETVLDALPQLVAKYNVIHQAGTANLEEVSGIASVALKGSPYLERYRAFGLLNTLAIRMSAGIATLIVSRAGSGTIFEIASWAIPAILVPIPPDVSHDQTENAYSYARAGGGIVIEQQNLSPHVLAAEVDRLMDDAALRTRMHEAAQKFARPEAAEKIATILLETALAHEPV